MHIESVTVTEQTSTRSRLRVLVDHDNTRLVVDTVVCAGRAAPIAQVVGQPKTAGDAFARELHEALAEQYPEIMVAERKRVGAK